MSEGVEVMAGAPILLMHAATQKPLCLEACKVPTDYGIELELSGKQATQTNKKLHMEQLATVRKGLCMYQGMCLEGVCVIRQSLAEAGISYASRWVAADRALCRLKQAERNLGDLLRTDAVRAGSV